MADDGWAMVHNRITDDTRLTKSQVATYLALCRHARGAVASVSLAQLATSSHSSVATVKRARAVLADLGHISWTLPRASHGGFAPATYTIRPLATHLAARAKMTQPLVHHDPTPMVTMTQPLVQREPTIKEQDYSNTEQEGSAHAALTPGLIALYTRLIGHEPKLAIGTVLEDLLADVGEMKLSAMMLESHDSTGCITPGTLTIARRKLERRRRGNVISLPPPADFAPPPLPDEPNPIWRAVLAELRLVITAGNFNQWFYRTRVVAEASDHITVSVPSHQHAEWIKAKLNGRVTKVMQNLGYGEMRIEYVVHPKEGEVNA